MEIEIGGERERDRENENKKEKERGSTFILLFISNVHNGQDCIGKNLEVTKSIQDCCIGGSNQTT